MSRLRPNASSGRDESGRPIVAELGRAETPLEAADRKAARRAAHYRNQTGFNLVIATIASLGIVAFLFLVVVRPTEVPRDEVDYVAIAADVQDGVDAPLAAPVLPEGWSANRADISTAAADGIVRWRIGFVTPDNEYISLDQGVDANDSWVADRTAEAAASSTTTIGGAEWTVYDRRALEDPGNVAYALVAVFGDTTVVLSGTAQDDEFAELAAATAEGLR